MGKVSKRYAQALFALAREQESLEQILSQIEAIVSVVYNHPDLYLFFVKQLVTRSEAEAIIRALGGRFKLHPILVQFMLLLAANRRLSCLEEIVGWMHHLNEHFHNQLKGQVVSAYSLSAAQLKELTEILSKKFKKTVSLQAFVDSSLLGGMVLTMGSYILDTSLKTKLRAFQTIARG